MTKRIHEPIDLRETPPKIELGEMPRRKTDAPPPPEGTSPCGACSYKLEDKLFSGVCDPSYGAYPVSELTMRMIDRNGVLLEVIKGLSFFDRETSEPKPQGYAADSMTQVVPSTTREAIAFIKLTWKNALGQTVTAQIIPAHAGEVRAPR